MYFSYDDVNYEVEIIKKSTTKNTYIRIDSNLKIIVTTNTFSSKNSIYKLLDSKYHSICKMIEKQKTKNENNSGFYYLGKKYDIVYTNNKNIVFGESKVFFSKDFAIDKFYKKMAKEIFLQHLNYLYNNFSYNIDYPSLKIRKMTTRWGVCNIKLKTITLNLELIKRDLKYLDYVIIHELSHLIYQDHSKKFWQVVEDNYPNYKQIRKSMEEF